MQRNIIEPTILGPCTLYLGDCLEILPMLSGIDAVITDPPYGMEFRSNFRHERHDLIMGDDCLPVERIEAAIGKAARFSYVFCRWDNLKQLPPPKSVLAWVKNNWSMGDLKHEHGRQWEACAFYPAMGHEFIKRIPDVIYADRTGNDLHPTQKPVGAIAPLINANVGETILDPFMGSGTTGIACIRTGRKFIGIEKDPKHFATAVDRIRRELQQPQLFKPESEKIEQAPLL